MDSMDNALAQSQLTLLYRLGVLQDPGEIENDSHAFLNRLPPPSTILPYQPSGEDAPSKLGAWKETTSHITISARRQDDDTNEVHIIQAKWFRVWKQRVEAKWMRIEAMKMATRRHQHRVLRAWRRVVYQRQWMYARCRQLGVWRLRRKIQQWAVESAVRHRLRWFLAAHSRGLRPRIQRYHVFVQWKQWTHTQRRQHRLYMDAAAMYHYRLMRMSWMYWRVSVFLIHQQRKLYRQILEKFRSHVAQRQIRRAIVNERYDRCLWRCVERLVRRWRLWNDAKQREHVRVYRVQMLLQRGRYWTIWWNTLRDKQRIDRLQRRVYQRIQYDHLWAWYTAVRASVLSRSSTLWHPEAICARYWTVWKRWTWESSRFRRAREVVHARQQRRALRTMRVWTMQHKRFSCLVRTADAITRRRILQLVWEHGWLVVHFQRQQDKKRIRQIQQLTVARWFGLWQRVWLRRYKWRVKKAIAKTRGFQSTVGNVWTAWRRHIRQRRLQTQQVRQGDRHYRDRLLRVGFVALSTIVDRKCAHATAIRRIRGRQRMALIQRVFYGWKHHTKRTVLLIQRLDEWWRRPSYASSSSNPLRRSWKRWQVFMHLRKCLHVLYLRRNNANKDRVFHAWKRRALIASLARAAMDNLVHRRCQTVLTVWKDRVIAWKRQAHWKHQAQAQYRRVHGVRVLYAWHTVVIKRLRRIRHQYQQVHSQYLHHIALHAFQRWRDQLRQCQYLHQWKVRRQRAWLVMCWHAWATYHHHKVKDKRKLDYYRQHFGLYPTTSPVRRLWWHWKSYAVLGTTARTLRRRCAQREVRQCLSAWKTFRWVKRILRLWHTYSLITAASTNYLGKRRRRFRQDCQQSRCRWMFTAWARVTQWRRRQHARIAWTHQRLLLDIPHAVLERRTYRRCLLRLWFQRWRRRQLGSLDTAVRWYNQRIKRNVLYAWWRHVIHQKQERLLQEARHTMTLMSAHRSSQRHGDETGRPSRATSDLNQRRVLSTPTKKREPSGRQRMVDPVAYPTSYQQQRMRPSSVVRKKEETNRHETRPPRQRVVSGPNQREERNTVIRHSQRNTEATELPLFDEELPIEQVVSMDPQLPPVPNGEISLETLASLDPYSPVRQPSVPPQHPLTQPSTCPPPAEVSPHQVTAPTVYTPTQSLRPHDPTAASRPVSRGPTKRSTATQELAALLEIPQHKSTQRASTFRAILRDMNHPIEETSPKIDVDRIVDIVIEYYVVHKDPSQAQGWLETMGFCMLRDLGLFTNGYFVGAMEQAIKRIPSAEQNDYRLLRGVLCEFVDKHPQFMFYTTKETTGNRLDALEWLVTCHLVCRHGRAMVSTKRDQHAHPFWIHHALPVEMVTSLPKLIKCIKKYHKPLEVFFAWQRDKTMGMSTRGRMDTATFVALMKHCNVYPQLFDRCELEYAVESAGSRHHSGTSHEIQLNMPQFVEALVRCALGLKWIDEVSQSTRSEDLVVVVKFLMLVFAMEGRGSMLTKRSQDLEVVLRFLQREDTESKAAKLRRFQGLLRAESVTPKPKTAKSSSAFRTAMTEHTRRVDFETRTSAPTQIPVLRTRRTVSEADQEAYAYSVPSNGWDPDPVQGPKQSEERKATQTSQSVQQPITSIEHDTPVQRPESLQHNEVSTNAPSQAFVCEQPKATASETTPAPLCENHSLGLQVPMDRDAFLHDILSSIHDVEILLQQSDTRRPLSSTPQSSTMELDVELTSEPFSAAYPDRYAILMKGHLPTEIDHSDTLPTDDIVVRDPLLDRLTFADRFSESTDWQSHLSIADLAAHGIHAAFPSAMHVRSTLETSELDDLTDPQQTAAYLRAHGIE